MFRPDYKVPKDTHYLSTILSAATSDLATVFAELL